MKKPIECDFVVEDSTWWVQCAGCRRRVHRTYHACVGGFGDPLCGDCLRRLRRVLRTKPRRYVEAGS